MGTSVRKKEKRKQRKIRNKQKEVDHKINAWNSGKLIEENHNNGPYSEKYTLDLSERLWNMVTEMMQKPYDQFIQSYRTVKDKIKDLIVYWNPEVGEYNVVYIFLKQSLELYWDNDKDIIRKLQETKEQYGVSDM